MSLYISHRQIHASDDGLRFSVNHRNRILPAVHEENVPTVGRRDDVPALRARCQIYLSLKRIGFGVDNLDQRDIAARGVRHIRPFVVGIESNALWFFADLNVCNQRLGIGSNDETLFSAGLATKMAMGLE